ncbi:hypothetical protein [Chromobacterium amazonense]|uniref:Uncharacterized protein n=1 Tax=Chromobacterium amazonense TaxID=1382803 RepID=A0ABU8V2N6_9NEIS|nr:hypothetical protein [Chromobacterium amazonense]MDQ4538865.1 hypothetical protein [Chromobacterium amazonense]
MRKPLTARWAVFFRILFIAYFKERLSLIFSRRSIKIFKRMEMDKIDEKSNDGIEWENYCEKILRLKYSRKSFFTIPHEDRGDHGLEFFTRDGTIFQCYKPNGPCSMEEHKKKIQKKINDDLKKLDQYKNEIIQLLDGTVINEWVLLTPEIRTKDLIKYCNKKAKETIQKNIPYIDNKAFHVKIETDNSFPEEKIRANRIRESEINVEVQPIPKDEMESWKISNANFHQNLHNKCSKISTPPDQLIDEIIERYLVLEDLTDAYRDEFPDLYVEVSRIASDNLTVLKNDSLFSKVLPNDTVSLLLKKNRENLTRITQKISENNLEAFAIGFISKWLAECKMDFAIK